MKTIGVAVAVAVVSVTSVGAFAAASLSNSVQTVHLTPVDGAPAQTGAKAMQGAVDFVIVGSDSRQGQSESGDGDRGSLNNDVTMLVHISEDHRQMTAVSIPRDTMVPLPACLDTDTGIVRPATTGMFNTALSRGGDGGGLKCVVDTVANLTGIQAAYGGIFKFDGVAAMASAVGGVDVCIASPIHDRYVGLDLGAGTQNIDGQTASKFLRSRHGVDDGSDLARISNQQVFLAALARKVLAPGGALSNPVTLYRLANAALSNMVVSDNLKNVDTMVALALTLKGMDLSKILFVQYPTLSDPSNVNRLIVDQDPAHALNVALQTDAKTNLDESALGRGATSDEPGSAPSAPAASADPDSEDTAAASTGADAPVATPRDQGATALPSAVSGQDASQPTCSKGSG